MEQNSDDIQKIAAWLPEIRRFLSHGASELRTPLNSIIGISEQMLEGADPLTQEQRKQLTEVIHSAKFFLHQFEDLLYLARIETGVLQLQLQEIDLKPLIQRFVSKPIELLTLGEEVGLTWKYLIVCRISGLMITGYTIFSMRVYRYLPWPLTAKGSS